MNTFEEAVSAARDAKAAIERLEKEEAEGKQALATLRADFAATEGQLVDVIAGTQAALEEARKALQAALQRQNDAPLRTGEDKAASAFAALETAAPADAGGEAAIDPYRYEAAAN